MFIRNQRGMVLYNTDNLISISVAVVPSAEGTL